MILFSPRRLALVMLPIFLAVCPSSRGQAQTLPGATKPAEQLKFVVIVSRHGVRSPTGKIDQLNRYSAQPWPAWSVPPGYLTEHGAKLMTLFGAYDREFYGKAGLLSVNGCSDASHVVILADSDQRTRDTGKALAAGLMPGCEVQVRTQTEGTPDPLFHSLDAGVGHPDKMLATAAVSGRIGGEPSGLTEAYRPQLEALEGVLLECERTSSCPAANTPAPANLLDVPSSIAPGKADHLVDLRGPLATAATMSENLLLEYAEGMAQVGWGRVDLSKLRELMQLHTASADIERRTPYLARVQASNLLAHILDSMQQAVSNQPVAGALVKPGDRLLILVGHDTNLANISGDLGLSWLIDGRRDDTPPGGALIFELWESAKSEYSVRTYYTAQTLDQMRNATPLSLASPPERVTVFVPGCSQADASCMWSDFSRTIRSAIDIDFVR